MDDIAVIGLACRFPGARDADAFWANLAAGVESITRLPEERRPGHVPAAPLLADHDRFDAAFFGYSPREAALLDPQQRVFLECAWTAMENAGHAGGPEAVGVYAGAALNSYLLFTGLAERLHDDYLLTLTSSDKDFLASRVAYKLGLTGPAVSVQTACSSSLVAVHLAVQSLRAGECDLALAGGVSVRVPQRAGYPAEPGGGVLSPDGHCRPFDAAAAGTLFGSGAGAVVLRPLHAALAAGDHVHAVIKGSAVNNDGATKVDYTAPSVTGQAEVVAEALADADVDPDTVGYVEAHGSGTPLGDPIEVAALTKAFRRRTSRVSYCAIGSVKSNIGHLDAAAGIAGLIKTVLALEHGRIPPTLHFREPNPRIDFPSTPFYPNAALSGWPERPGPRRAGVSSLGIGGTNAHVVLEEPAGLPPSGGTRREPVVLVSARSEAALERATANLDAWLAEHPAANRADVAYTLQVGRRAFEHRRAWTAGGVRPPATRVEPGPHPVAFVYPGGGGNVSAEVAELYAADPVFRDRLDHGLDVARRLTGKDLSNALLDPGTDFRRPSVQLPALFLVEDALTVLWGSWGVRPSALLGHSMGELTAAYVAGVLGFSDALGVIATRGRLLETEAPGGMLSVPLPYGELRTLLDGAELDIAAINTPESCVVSGAVEALDALAERLTGTNGGVDVTRLPIDTAAHSRLCDALLPEFRAHLAEVELRPPAIPFVSNVTGTWITAEQATDPGYWASQVRSAVRFADGAAALLAEEDRPVLEAGPGRTLGHLLRRQPGGRGRVVVPALPVAPAQAALWQAGAEIDWAACAAAERRRRVPLPTYPFERQRHWYGGERRPSVRLRLPRLRLPRRPRRDPLARPSEQRGPARGEPPGTPTERAVAVIWRDVLGTAAPSIHDDFFDLGGSSMLVAQAMRRVNETFGVELSPLILMESPTIAGLAACVDAVREPDRRTDGEDT